MNCTRVVPFGPPAAQIDRVTQLYLPDDPGKLRNYAFINYTERSAAVRAVSEGEIKKHTMADKELIVSRRRPPDSGSGDRIRLDSILMDSSASYWHLM